VAKRGEGEKALDFIGASEGIRTLDANPKLEFSIFLGNLPVLNEVDEGECCHYCCHYFMASIRIKERSPFYFACFTLPGGTRTQRSTGVPIAGVKPSDFAPLAERLGDVLDAQVCISKSETPSTEFILNAREAKRLAERVALAFEDAARNGKAGFLTEQKARKAIADVFSLANKDAMPSSTIRQFLDSWLKRKELEASEKTHQRYARVVELLLEFLGSRARLDITHLTSKEIAGFRDQLAKKLTPATVNVSVKVIRAALAHAKRDGLVDVNEGERVTLLKRTRGFERKPFTLAELKRILEVANDEWRGMILVGLYTGLRLSDVATLTWANLDLQREELRVTTSKTGRRQILPLVQPLVKHFTTLPAGDDASAPLFPDAHAARQRSQYGGTLSNQFYNILVAAGLAKARTHESTGKGRDAKRELGGLSFHSLRHTATSLLKNAGVSDAVARDIIGHDSAAVSAHYTHIDSETKRKALDAMPDVLS
jgi:integrase